MTKHGQTFGMVEGTLFNEKDAEDENRRKATSVAQFSQHCGLRSKTSTLPITGELVVNAAEFFMDAFRTRS